MARSVSFVGLAARQLFQLDMDAKHGYICIYIHIDWSINAKTYVNILDWRGRIGLQIVGVIGI